MRLSIVALAPSIAFLSCGVYADDQNPFGLPTCNGQSMKELFDPGFQELGCSVSDVKCICNYPAYLQGIPSIAADECSQDQVNQIQKNIETQCKKFGVEIFTAGATFTAVATASSLNLQDYTISGIESYRGIASSVIASATDSRPTGSGSKVKTAATGTARSTATPTGGAAAKPLDGGVERLFWGAAGLAWFFG